MQSVPKISVIIPVYNAGARLINCIDSLVGQTCRDIEVIFVLDCPTDGSKDIVYNYAKKHSNIKVIENEKNLNTGLSRNKGLDIATGEYIAFCDHDDIVMPEMYERMYEIAKRNEADIILGVPQYRYENKTEVYYYPQEGNIRDILLPLIVGKNPSFKEWSFYFSHGVIWDNIYKRKLVEDNHIRFVDNNKTTFEDNLFLIDALIHSERVDVLNELVYIHTIEPTNTAASAGYVRIDKIISYLEELDTLLNENHLREKYDFNFTNSLCRYIKDNYQSCYKPNLKDLLKVKQAIGEIKSSSFVINIIKDKGLRYYIAEEKGVLLKIFHTFGYFLLTI